MYSENISYMTHSSLSFYIHSICLNTFTNIIASKIVLDSYKISKQKFTSASIMACVQHYVKPSTIVATLVPEEGQFSFSHRRQTDHRESSSSLSLRRHLFQMLYKIATRTLPFLCADDRNVCIYMSVHTHTNTHKQKSSGSRV